MAAMLRSLHHAPRRLPPISKHRYSIVQSTFVPYRSFHPTATHRDSQVLAAAANHVSSGSFMLDAARHVFVYFHNAPDASWALSIPLATLVLRGSIYVVVNLWTHLWKKNIAAAQPLVAASTRALATLPPQPKYRDIFNFNGEWKYNYMESRSKLWMKHNDLKQFRAAVKLRYNASEHRITALALLNLPLWFIIVETLRSMCGTSYGLLGLVMKGLGFDVQPGKPLHPEWIEPSMATEGAAWFPNLLLPDPTGFLSIILAACTSVSVYRSLDTYRKSDYFSTHPLYKRAIRLTPFLPLLLIPMTWKFPAAMLLYWTTSALFAGTSGYLNARYLRYAPPVRPLTNGLDHLAPVPMWLLGGQRSSKTRHLGKRRASIRRLCTAAT